MLSKMAKPKEKTVTDYCNDIAKKDLSKSKLSELKQYARDLNLKISGTKPLILARVEECLLHTKNVIKIQRIARKYLVIKWFKMKGSSKNCVNDSDFYTLEPLSEIPYLYYFQHAGGSSHNYGFNIKSLCTLAIKNNNKFENPYNRENMKPVEQKIADVVKLTNAIFPENQLMKDILELNDGVIQSTILTLIRDKRPIITNRFQNQLRALERMTIEQRVIGLFMYIDRLGNYTQTHWLTDLSSQKMYYMIVKINQLWHTLPRELRSRICPHMSPFGETVFGTTALSPNDITLRIVVRMAEVLIYSGIDSEHQNLGAMYLLSGLTMVSLGARSQLPWLYDNYFTIVQ